MSVVLTPSFVDLLIPVLFVLVIFYVVRRFFSAGKRRVAVLVLGDVGRSPRMQHHAISLAVEGFNVDLIGFDGSKPFQEVLDNRKIAVHFLSDSTGFHKLLPRTLRYAYKVARHSFSVFCALYLRSKKPSIIFLQNPPGLPAIAVAKFVCVLQRSSLIIDWHNYGFSIMELSLGPRSRLVNLARWYEGVFGRMAELHFCVTKAMKEDLSQRWGIKAEVLYDRPARMSGPTPLEDRHDLCMKLGSDYKAFSASESSEADTRVSTSGLLQESAFTRSFLDETTEDGDAAEMDAPPSSSPWVLVQRRRHVHLREDRPALLVSSTSWTQDEDFSILLRALDAYDDDAATDPSLPPLVCAITGKGPQKAYYIEEIGRRCWGRVSVCTPWLEPSDYPLLLGSADLGVSLHFSSSGLDLPMKVVDMFGSGLPVCAIQFPCLSELVQDGRNGLHFQDHSQLALQLADLLRGFPWKNRSASNSALLSMKANLETFRDDKWHDSWTEIVLPLLKKR